MAILSEQERPVAEAISQIGFCNPFSRLRIELERRVLGARFFGEHRVMSLEPGADITTAFPNAMAMIEMSAMFANQMRGRILEGQSATAREMEIYQDLTLFFLYGKNMSQLGELGGGRSIGTNLRQKVSFWKKFRTDFDLFFQPFAGRLPHDYSAAHAFAVFFQIERAFRFIYYHIHGSSLAISRVRADIWDSIFTQDMRAYARAAYDRMHEIPTLIQGESGTGKELVARAIGKSQYIPFDEGKQAFQLSTATPASRQGSEKKSPSTIDADEILSVINLACLVPNLIESELFGHAKNSFTGATLDRIGWLEMCPRGGAVFLDELGELDVALQSKLLRVIQFRDFNRVGEYENRRFAGKFIAATNRDLAVEVRQGRFRDDLYFRFCADQVQTCTLREQIREQPGDLSKHIRNIAARIFRREADEAGVSHEADQLTERVTDWIDTNLDPDYDWPGNFRELEQCVRNVMIHNRYSPQSGTSARQTPEKQLVRKLENLDFTVKELTGYYATLAYSREGSYKAAAEKLGIDWKTLKSHIDEKLLESFRRH